MPLQKYVHQVKIREDKHEADKVEFLKNLILSEAYDIIPKSEGEIDELDIPHDKEQLKALFTDVVTQSGVGDPIAISKNPKEKGIKIVRSVADDLNLASLSKKYGFKISAGNGSRGGTGTKSMGFGFEGQVFKDIETYIAEGEDSVNFKYPDFMKALHDTILSKHSEVSVTLDGGKNTRRPLVFTDIGALIKGRELNIGQYVTDITVLGDGKPYYLSLKYGGTVTFFNAGVATIFTEDQFKAGKFKNRNAKQLLKMLGIDEKRFIETFEGYDKKTASRKASKDIVDVTINIEKVKGYARVNQ